MRDKPPGADKVAVDFAPIIEISRVHLSVNAAESILLQGYQTSYEAIKVVALSIELVLGIGLESARIALKRVLVPPGCDWQHMIRERIHKLSEVPAIIGDCSVSLH